MYDEEGLGYSSQIQSFTTGKRLLLLSELDWSEPGGYNVNVGNEYGSFQRAKRHGKKGAGIEVSVKSWKALSVNQAGILVCLTATCYSKR